MTRLVDDTQALPTHTPDGSEIFRVVHNGQSKRMTTNDLRITLRSPALEGGATAPSFDVVAELTDPSIAANRMRHVVISGPSPVFAFCDGEKWWNLTSGAEISPWWLPIGATLHVDFENSRFYWGGAVKLLSDLTLVSGAAYSLTANGGITGGEATVVLEYTPSQTNGQWSNTLFSWTSGYPSGNRFEWIEADDTTYGDKVRLYYSPGVPSANFQTLPVQSKMSEGGTRYIGNARQKAVTVLKSSTAIKAVNGNSVVHTDLTGTPGTIATPTLIGFGCRAWSATTPDSVASNITLHRVTLYPSAVGNPSANAIGSSGRAYPIHLIGDSFLNNYNVLMQLEKRIGPDGYIGLSQDGVGGSTLTQQAVRYAAADAKWRDATLVICDFGRETNAVDSIAALEAILGLITHDRWIYMQSAPSSPPGDVYDAEEAQIAAWCGDRYISTLAPAFLESDGSPADVARVAQRMWPLSLVNSAIDFHPNYTAGTPFIARLIDEALTARGWI